MMTLLRTEEYRALRDITLSGRVLDLGGSKNSEYHRLFRGTFSITTANLSPNADIVCDFEKVLPIDSASYDTILLINVLEHIFEYRQLLREVARILRSGGTVIIVVPFLFPYHASPDDFHRYTAHALLRMCQVSGFEKTHIVTLGSGVCAVRWVLLERLLPRPLHFLSSIARPLVRVFDRILVGVVRLLGKKYIAEDYPLGYVVTASLPL